MPQEIAFNMATSNIRFGCGVTQEVGMDCKDLDLDKLMVVVDPALRELPPVTVALQALEDAKVSFLLFDAIKIEPTDESIQEAVSVAVENRAQVIKAATAIEAGKPCEASLIAKNSLDTMPALSTR